MDHVDCLVVGAGVVGLAIARALGRHGRQVLVLDAGDELGAGTSGRGSGVIHAGLYDPPGSLKARLCVEGRALLYAFAEAQGVPHRRTGKLVVATSTAEVATLEDLASRARENGVDDIELLSGEAAMALEPALRCEAALLSPSTGVIAAAALMRALLDDAEAYGIVSALRAPVTAVRPARTGFIVEIGGEAPMLIGCHTLVNAAGHGAPALAQAIEGLPATHVPQQYFAKGNYFALDRPAPFARLIYPVAVPGGLGTHLAVDVGGTARFGPDVEWVDHLDYVVDPARAERFYADVRRWWPGLPDGGLAPSHAGVRPKIAGPGEPARDFVIDGASRHGVPGLVHLFGIESPGLTASLAIGDHVAALLTD